MSDFFDDSHVTDVGLQGSAGPSVSPFDMLEQTIRQQWHVDSQRALDEELRTRWAESLRALSAAGQRFNSPVDPQMYRGFARFVRDGTPVTTPTVEGSGYGARINYDAQQPSPEFEEMRRANEAIRQLNNPDIRTFEQILEEVSAMQQDVEEETASMRERAGWAGFFFGELPGAIIGSFTTRDPLNVITAPIGAGRTIATRIASDMAVAAGVVTATEFGDVAPNRALAGLPERNPLLNIVAATAGAGLIRTGLIEPAGHGIRHLRGRSTPEDLAIRRFFGWSTPENFELRDSQLREILEANGGPTARAGAQALDDVTFIERNNPYGEGQAAQARFLAELQEVQRVMGGEPMTAIARVLPPIPFEQLRKAADFEIVREQAPAVYARMEQAQARVAELREGNMSFERVSASNINEDTNVVKFSRGSVEGELIWKKGETEAGINIYGEGTNTASISELRAGLADIKTEFPELETLRGIRMSGARGETPQEVRVSLERTPLSAERRAANKEYKAFYGAVEREAVRLREVQARAEAAQQREAVHIFADATYGRPFNWSALQHDNVQARVDAINAFNDTLDEKAVALFVRQAKSETEAGTSSPTVYFHGTNVSFDKFEVKKGWSRRGITLTEDRSLAEHYAKVRQEKLGGEARTVAAKVNYKNPLHVDETNDYEQFIDEAIEGGYDAIIGPAHEGPNAPKNITVFDPDLIEIVQPPERWLTEDGRVDIGLREPVDPEFRITTDDGDMSIADAMRDLQDDVDLDEAMRTCLR